MIRSVAVLQRGAEYSAVKGFQVRTCGVHVGRGIGSVVWFKVRTDVCFSSQVGSADLRRGLRQVDGGRRASEKGCDDGIPNNQSESRGYKPET